MSDRVVVVDETIPDQWNAGNAEAAMAARNVFVRDKAVGYIHKEVSQQRLVEADRELLKADLGVRDSGLLRNFEETVRRWETSGVSRLNRFPSGYQQTAALALFLKEQGYKVEVMTMNRQFADAWRAAGGIVTRDVAHITAVAGKTDYYKARRLVLGSNARTLNIASNGRVLPAQKPAPGPRTSTGARLLKGPTPVVGQRPLPKAHLTPDGYHTATVNGKPHAPATANQSQMHGTKKQVGQPISPTNENRVHPSYSSKDAKFQIVKIAIQLLNRTVQVINDRIQTEKLNEAWKKTEPSIRKELESKPELGALLLAHYSKREKTAQENYSDLEHTATFRGLAVSYGYTREQAKDRYDKGPDQIRERGPHQQPYYIEWAWIAPERDVDFSKLETPFPSAGLAKFVDGREVLTRVKFSIWGGGFDDKIYSTEQVSSGQRARFLYLYVPNEVSYIDQGQRGTKSIEIALTSPAIVPNIELKGLLFLPVVQLDSFYNPYDALAVAVFPADTYTMRLFEETKPTDTGNIQVSDSRLFRYVRWVKPHRMEVLKHFGQVTFD